MNKAKTPSLWSDLDLAEDFTIGRAASQSFLESAHKFSRHALNEMPENVTLIRPISDDAEVLFGLRYALWDSLEAERKRRLQLTALSAGQAWLAHNLAVPNEADAGLALRLHDDPMSRRSPGYYVSRTYRGLWFILLLVGLVWGTITGFVLGSGSGLLSPSALLMGFLGTIVLALTLISAGSRERIRRHRTR